MFSIFVVCYNLFTSYAKSFLVFFNFTISSDICYFVVFNAEAYSEPSQTSEKDVLAS